MIANLRVTLPRPFAALHLRVSTGVALGGLIAGSAIVRAVGAVNRVAPSYFPDEYIYTAISRSLATSGRPLVRGGPAHFPALLEPLLAAPLWTIGSVETAHHLVQIENAILFSFAALPVYGIARRLELGRGYSLFCAAFALAVPDLAYAGSILSDPVGYLVALTALWAGVVALQRPTAWSQLAFVALAGLATFARVQYVILAPAYVVAALVLDRRSAVRTQRWVLAVFGAAALAVVALGTGRVLGYYTRAGHQISAGFFKWLGLETFFLVLTGGVVLAPGAVIGLATARDRRDRAFTALVIPFALMVLAEGALYASDNPFPRYKERYLMALLPLLPLAFGLYLRRGRPWRVLVLGAAAAVAALAALLPLSGYAAGTGYDDSPLLWNVYELERYFGTANGSLVFAAGATIGAALCVAVAWGRLVRPAIAVAFLAVAALSIGATCFDAWDAANAQRNLVAPNPAWVDAAGLGSVTAIETDAAPASLLTEQLFWNSSIQRELVLGSQAAPTDVFAAKRLSVTNSGELRVGGRPLETPILFQGFEVTPTFVNAAPVARFRSFSLWRPTGPIRLRALELGRFGDGWLSARGNLRVWAAGSSGGTVSFTLWLPRSAGRHVVLRFGARVYRIAPGQRVQVSLRIDGSKPWQASFAGLSGIKFLPDLRPVTVRSTVPVFTPR